MTIYLYKKTHNITGLKYLGKTTRDPFKYKGSGTHWIRHIKKHGNDVTTEILHECSTIDELRELGLYYSYLWNVVESKEWANIKPEEGDGWASGKYNPNCKPERIEWLKENSEHLKGGKIQSESNQKRLNNNTHHLVGPSQNKLTLSRGTHPSQTRKVCCISCKQEIIVTNFMRHDSSTCTLPSNPMAWEVKWTCEHCSKSGTGAVNYKRWHGDNCKHNPDK